MKLITQILLTAFIIFILFLAACKGLVNHIYNRTDCEQFNIDNIEVRTGIDIPAVSDVTCEFKSTENTKISVFILDKSVLDFDYYIQRNKFIREGDFYVNAGERTDTKWNARLNKENLELRVALTYK
ncbi:MAG: hypothetical protein AAGJ18_13090 [Bacteroidota bacterium]